jgi:hypothetical protein
MLSILLSLSGASKVWNVLDGYKVKIASALAILTALGQMLLAAAGLGHEIAGMLAAHQAAGLLTLIQHISADPFAVDLGKAWVMLLASGATLGFGHKLDKHTAALQAAAAVPAQAAPAQATPTQAVGIVNPVKLAAAGAQLAALPAMIPAVPNEPGANFHPAVGWFKTPQTAPKA